MSRFDGYTPEQEVLNQKRAAKLEELQKGGAMFKATAKGDLALEPTAEQMDAAQGEMERELSRQPDVFMGRLQKAIEEEAKKQEMVAAKLKNELEKLGRLHDELKQGYMTPGEMAEKIRRFAARFGYEADQASKESGLDNNEFKTGQPLEVNGYWFSIKRNEDEYHRGGGWEIMSPVFSNMGPRHGVFSGDILAFGPYNKDSVGEKEAALKNDQFAQEVVRFIIDTANRLGKGSDEHRFGLEILKFIDRRTEEIRAEIKKTKADRKN